MGQIPVAIGSGNVRADSGSKGNGEPSDRAGPSHWGCLQNHTIRLHSRRRPPLSRSIPHPACSPGGRALRAAALDGTMRYNRLGQAANYRRCGYHRLGQAANYRRWVQILTWAPRFFYRKPWYFYKKPERMDELCYVSKKAGGGMSQPGRFLDYLSPFFAFLGVLVSLCVCKQ